MDQPPPSGNPQLSAHIDHNRFVGRTRVAYFSMEIAISPEMPTYSGGLGILAGDTARAAADLDLPIVFVTLISRAGYLRQELDAGGHQGDLPDPWDPQLWARPLPAMVAVPIAERAVWVRPWLHVLQCPTGGAVPILLLDTDVSENDPDDRGITSRLYGGDATLRLKQEIVLGIGGEILFRGAGFPDRHLSLQRGSCGGRHRNRGYGHLGGAGIASATWFQGNSSPISAAHDGMLNLTLKLCRTWSKSPLYQENAGQTHPRKK